MKFSLVAAVVLLALAQGSFAQDATDLEKFTDYLEDMKNKMLQELTKIINQDMATQAQTFLEQGKTQLEPLASQIQTMAGNVEEQIKPLTAKVQAQMQPLFETLKQQMEAIFQKGAE